MSNKILVLGATGNIGSILTRNLADKKADIVAGVPAGEMSKISSQGLPAVPVDFNAPSSLDAAMRAVDSLFLLLPLAEPMERWGRNIIEAAQRNRVGFVLRSSLIDARPDSPYSLFRIHGTIDQMLRDSGIPYAIVHPNSFMQNFVVYYAGSINNNNAFYFTQGDAKISYIDVRDIAAVDAEILANPDAHRGREYNVTGPASLSPNVIAGILSRAAGRTIRYISVSEAQYTNSLRQNGWSDWDLDMTLSLEHHIKDGKQAVVTGDVRAVTGRDPILFEKFARDYASAWQKVPVTV